MSSKNLFSCPNCGKKFEEKTNLVEHLKNSHVSEIPIKEEASLNLEEFLVKENKNKFDFNRKEVEEYLETKEAQEDEEEIRNKKKLIKYFKKLRPSKSDEGKFEEYSKEKHGPLVDLSISESANYDVIDTYSVNEPYAYIRITYDPETHTNTYRIIEPDLNETERKILDELKEKLVKNIDIDLREVEKDAEKHLRKKITEILRNLGIKLGPKQREKIIYFLVRNFYGFGKIDPLMKDPRIEDISCDGPNIPVYIYHQKYESAKTNITFNEESKLDSFVIKLAQRTGRHISVAQPLLDGTLPDGSRIQISLSNEVTTKGSTFTIRKYREEPFTPPDLVDFNTFSSAMVAYFWLAVENGKSVIFAGGTASGKTTSLNAISLFIPPEMKIVSIEDTRELNLPQPNWIPGVTRQSFGGTEETEIGMYKLLKSALRQRPEYVVVGEVRGEEAYVLFQAMSTGHTCFSTMHADSVQSAVHRLENPPINVPRSMLESLDIFSIQTQARIGGERVRRCKDIVEIVGVDPHSGELLTNKVFTWIPARDEFRYSGTSNIFEEIIEEKGMNESEIEEELERRQKIIEWMRLKDIRHYEDVAKVVVGYYREPERIMETVREELYEK
ncbi:MAG: ATPase involved in archaellum/pili biosynthesis FlaI [Candidatus Methanohalarchaeum thermophilum]|uniref:ATPase involved in archaellum/pili biosynthesis FlaI n=1 Tax=Methanohalarchaeum thermophilum TaxID=1903181 RepID=A0A1Q6DUU8_METT1|nr:MAG: ATPase involved in archaellum/pili biosynthesis FlaI [Candidatus Methanohalarchaeum thermophilum]